jgi:hypothetical protein
MILTNAVAFGISVSSMGGDSDGGVTRKRPGRYFPTRLQDSLSA